MNYLHSAGNDRRCEPWSITARGVLSFSGIATRERTIGPLTRSRFAAITGAGMRVGYFGYYVRDLRTDQKYLIDLRAFFRDFANCPNVPFRSQFRWGGETLLLQLLDRDTNTYLFVQSRDLELVKRIRKLVHSADDISGVLGPNSSVGFASYVVIGKNWMSFACKVLSPRQTAFGNMVNELFQALNIRYSFGFTALQTELAPNQVQALNRVGRIDIALNQTSPVMQRVADLLTGGHGQRAVDAAEIRVSIVPRRSQDADLSRTLNDIVNELPVDGLESIAARAKLDAYDKMSDMFIYGSGAIRDLVVTDHENEIPAQMKRKKAANVPLNAKIREFRDDDDYETDRTAGELGISWARAYANRVVGP